MSNKNTHTFISDLVARKPNLFLAMPISPDICFQSKLQFPIFSSSETCNNRVNLWAVLPSLWGSGLKLNRTQHQRLVTNLLDSKPWVIAVEGHSSGPHVCFVPFFNKWHYCPLIETFKSQTQSQRSHLDGCALLDLEIPFILVPLWTFSPFQKKIFKAKLVDLWI